MILYCSNPTHELCIKFSSEIPEGDILLVVSFALNGAACKSTKGSKV